MILVFAAIYTAFDHANFESSCGLGVSGNPITFGAAFSFSLETCTTVGYGLPSGSDAYFRSCPWLQFVIYAQMVWSMMYNAFLFAFLFTRVGRCESRGVQVIFSRQAIISKHSNGFRFQIRVYDVDAKFPVVEAHVRMYALLKERPVPRPLRILQPDDELGAMLLLSLPNVVSHSVDVHSLLHPPGKEPLDNHGLILREADSAVVSRESLCCPVCGETFGTFERWVTHVRYLQAHEGKKADIEPHLYHSSITEEQLSPPEPVTIHDIKAHIKEHVSEILVVVEGTDPMMSGTFQALQSYRYEDIVWGEGLRFQPCLQVGRHRIWVDLNKFHVTGLFEKSMLSAAKNVGDSVENPRSLRAHDAVLGEKKHHRKNSGSLINLSQLFSDPSSPASTTSS